MLILVFICRPVNVEQATILDEMIVESNADGSILVDVG